MHDGSFAEMPGPSLPYTMGDLRAQGHQVAYEETGTPRNQLTTQALILHALSHAPELSGGRDWMPVLAETFRTSRIEDTRSDPFRTSPGRTRDVDAFPRSAFGGNSLLGPRRESMIVHPYQAPQFVHVQQPLGYASEQRPPTPSEARDSIPQGYREAPPSPPEAEPAVPENEAAQIIRRSSVGHDDVLLIAKRTSKADVAEILRRSREPRTEDHDQEAPPAEYTLEGWIASPRALSENLMRLGHSYARDGFRLRARLCFEAALDAGHPEAEDALQRIPPEPGDTPPSPDHMVHEQRLTENADAVYLIENGIKLFNMGDEESARAAFAMAVRISSTYSQTAR